REDAGGPSWKFALARFNFREMWVKRADKEIWRVGVSALDDNYITGNVGDVSIAQIRESAPAGTLPPDDR
ncbi:MAG TPA: hypothetical protein VKU82_04295, partial [Planctomycetaceae bacterium]|nr:hypothetical protein [Planctomycetaceae bacterium]